MKKVLLVSLVVLVLLVPGFTYAFNGEVFLDTVTQDKGNSDVDTATAYQLNAKVEHALGPVTAIGLAEVNFDSHGWNVLTRKYTAMVETNIFKGIVARGGYSIEKFRDRW